MAGSEDDRGSGGGRRGRSGAGSPGRRGAGAARGQARGEVIDFAPAPREASDAPDGDPAEGDDDVESIAVISPTPDSVGVTVLQRVDGTLDFTVTVPARLLADAKGRAVASYFDGAPRHGRHGGTPPAPDDVGFPDGAPGVSASAGDDAAAGDDGSADAARTAYLEFVMGRLRAHFLSEALLESGVLTFGRMHYADEGLPVRALPPDDEDFVFRAHTLVRPVIGLSSYDPVTVDFPAKRGVTEADVDAALLEMRTTAAYGEALETLERGGDSGAAGVPRADELLMRRLFPEAAAPEDMRDLVREVLERRSQEEYEGRLELACARELAGRLLADPPRPYVEETARELERGASGGYTLVVPDLGGDPGRPALGDPADPGASALEVTRAAIALDAYADYCDIQLTQEEVLGTFLWLNPDCEPDDLVEVMDAGEMPQLCAVAIQRAAARALAAQARSRGREGLHLV
ncbi:MAG: hypothetical protein SOI26_03005 [Coriobacteriales bacterium]|jgi:hypothetical protein